jgi:hypothetical protein
MDQKKILIETIDEKKNIYFYDDANLFEKNLYFFAEEQYISSANKTLPFKTQKYQNGRYEWYVLIDTSRNFFLISDELLLARKYLAINTKSDTTGPKNTYKILEPYLNLPKTKNIWGK